MLNFLFIYFLSELLGKNFDLSISTNFILECCILPEKIKFELLYERKQTLSFWDGNGANSLKCHLARTKIRIFLWIVAHFTEKSNLSQIQFGTDKDSNFSVQLDLTTLLSKSALYTIPPKYLGEILGNKISIYLNKRQKLVKLQNSNKKPSFNDFNHLWY